MFPFVRKSRYDALRKDCQAWMHKAARNESEMLNAVRRLDELRACLNEAQRIANGIPKSESVLEDE